MAPFGSAAKLRDKKANQKSRKQAHAPKNANLGSNSAGDSGKAKSVIPIALQQAVLDVFAGSFGPQDANELRERIQRVKGCLYNRDFLGAFESEEYQEAYCLRWSPSRALAYLELLCSIPDVFEFLKRCVNFGPNSSQQRTTRNTDSGNNIITCIGGGAGAEAVAFAAALKYAADASLTQFGVENRHEEPSNTAASNETVVHAIDIASWRSVIINLDAGIRSTLTPPPAGSSSSAQANTISSLVSESDPRTEPATSFLPTINFHHIDVLALDPSSLAQLISSSASSSSPSSPSSTAASSSSPTLITILFTLNELYSTSMSRTTSLLLSLTSLTSVGTFILVVDSPGSYSTVKLGETEKRYPMQWMLDHTLLQQARKVEGDGEGMAKWEKVDAEESRWWRMDRERVRYRVPGVELEDMRMQWHLFRRV